jgi:hypothetical protein
VDSLELRQSHQFAQRRHTCRDISTRIHNSNEQQTERAIIASSFKFAFTIYDETIFTFANCGVLSHISAPRRWPLAHSQNQEVHRSMLWCTKPGREGEDLTEVI